MCELCGEMPCKAGCPSHVNRRELSWQSGIFCTECGRDLESGELYYRFPAGIACAECAELLDTDGILRLTKRRSVYALLDAIGAKRRFFV